MLVGSVSLRGLDFALSLPAIFYSVQMARSRQAMALTIGEKWIESKGRPSGFDMLRVVLSVSVILWHTLYVCYGETAEYWFWTGPLRPLVYVIIPAFFGLSGFLVASSLERNDLASFLTLRVIRIFPALAVEVLVSALLIGTFVTTLSLGQYFSHPEFKAYFLNMIGDIHYFLPGVFDELPNNYVNIQLWTVPYELYCYLILSALTLFGLHKRPLLMLLLLFVVIFITIIGQHITHTTPGMGRPDGFMLVFCFLFGVLLYFLKDKVIYSPWLLLASLVIFVFSIYKPATFNLAALPITYITVCIGLTNRKIKLFSLTADYSYGLYLYGYPIQQLISYLLPTYRVWYINFALTLIIAGALAYVSWHFVESKVLQKRKIILGIVRTVRLQIVRSLSGKLPSS
ncbi:MAG TPA: acyltransferase [Asticcacaulis sp.]|nr:acyltransferase [Asticcacaulis sp.]